MITNLVIWLYTALFTLCLPILFLRLKYRSFKNPEYRMRWKERLGFLSLPDHKHTQGLWIHAVSVGESMAAAPLIRAFQKKFPATKITVTTTTPTGFYQIKKLFGESVFHSYFPYDLPWTFHLFLKRLQPRLCVIMETELWINALQSLKRHQIPVMIANGRISPKSMQSYEKIKFLLPRVWGNLTHVAAQSKKDGQHFQQLGLKQDRLSVAGNMKFDCILPENIETLALSLRKKWGLHRPVWIAASTHKGEETLILNVFTTLKKEFKDLLLLLVPRHPERFNQVELEIQQYHFKMTRRSDIQIEDEQEKIEHTEVFLGDSMGELPLFYAAAEFAFVGGSMVPIGGHNVLEPGALEKPILVGPHMQNFSEITQLLIAAGGIKQVWNQEMLLETLQQWLRHPLEAKEMGLKAKGVVEENKGAVNKILTLIQPYFQ